MTIYGIINKESNKCYVGGTTQYYPQRKAQHKWFLRNQRHPNRSLQSDWNKYGESAFEFKVYEDDIDSVEQLECLEKHYAKKLKVKEKGYHSKDVYNYDSSKGKSIKNTVTDMTYNSIAKAFIDTGISRSTLTSYCKDNNNTEWVYV